jgi:hypothetical protein
VLLDVLVGLLRVGQVVVRSHYVSNVHYVAVPLRSPIFKTQLRVSISLLLSKLLALNA